MKVCSPARTIACRLRLRSLWGLTPLASSERASSRSARTSFRESAGYVPKDMRSRLPPHEKRKCHAFAPVAETKRERPSVSARVYGLPVALA